MGDCGVLDAIDSFHMCAGNSTNAVFIEAEKELGNGAPECFEQRLLHVASAQGNIFDLQEVGGIK